MSPNLKSVCMFMGLLGVLCVSVAGLTSAKPGQQQNSDVYAPFGCTPGDDCDVVGHSNLVRTPRGVTMNLQTTGLDPGAAYTVWWIVFNNPDECADGAGQCMGGDLGNEDVNGSVLWATGHVIGDNGVGNFAAHLAEGDTSGVAGFELPGDDDGLVDAMQAEIHLVVRTHGLPIPGMVYEQISTFAGGCGINACADQQFAIHP